MIDPFGRKISYLRVSVTDRCDFRCVYCMAEHMTFLPKAEVLSLEELDRLCSTFVGLGVKLLAIDEFGFYQAGSHDRQKKALNGLKYLGNYLQIPMVIAAVEEGLNVLSANEEIANRFPAEHLPRWKANDQNTLSLLASFESKLGLRKPSNLGTEGMAKLIIANTGGILGHMHDLVRELAKKALRSGAEQIVEADLKPEGLKQIRWVIPSLRHQRPV